MKYKLQLFVASNKINELIGKCDLGASAPRKYYCSLREVDIESENSLTVNRIEKLIQDGNKNSDEDLKLIAVESDLGLFVLDGVEQLSDGKDCFFVEDHPLFHRVKLK